MPVAKVIAATLGSAASIIIVYLFEVGFDADIPVAVEGAITTILTFLCGWITPARPGESAE